MSDRALLEMAAKAAGIVLFERDSEFGDSATGCPWNPLESSDDAKRMTAALPMTIACHSDILFGSATCVVEMPNATITEHGKGMAAVARRAVVRAAAEIGKEMP